MYKNCPPHLNIVLNVVKMKYHISYFYSALLEHHLQQAWCEA